MTSIRFHIATATVVSIAAIAGLCQTSLNYLNQYTQSQERLRLSFLVQDQVRFLDTRKFDHSVFEELKNFRRSFLSGNREEALSNIIQSYANQNPVTLRRQVEQFLENEKKYRDNQFILTESYKTKLRYFIFLFAGISSLILIFIYVYLHEAIFRQIDSLSLKMMDFLNQKYTYQFALPSNNEMGDLQATFNSLAQKVLSQMDELKSLDQAKSDFLSIASHELRTPLTSIKGSLGLLKTGIAGQLNETSNNLVHIAETETDRLIRLINDLLDLAKIDAHKLPLNKKWYTVAEIIKTSLDGIQGLAKTARVRLSHSEIPDLRLLVDRDRIQQVLMNLISNAIKHSPRNGHVQVKVEIDNSNNLLVSVHDHGKGIATEDQELIFQKFRQATNFENPLVKGTGLGLAIAKALVEEHNGYIGVESSIGKGSTFYFTLGDWQPILETDMVPQSFNSNGVAA